MNITISRSELGRIFRFSYQDGVVTVAVGDKSHQDKIRIKDMEAFSAYCKKWVSYYTKREIRLNAQEGSTD